MVALKRVGCVRCSLTESRQDGRNRGTEWETKSRGLPNSMMQNNSPPPLTATLNCLCCRTVLLPANCFLCPITQVTNKPLVSSFTFHARPATSTSEKYKRTHEETTCHPAPIFQFLRAILAVLQQQIQSQSSDESWFETAWFNGVKVCRESIQDIYGRCERPLCSLCDSWSGCWIGVPQHTIRDLY